MAIWVVLQDPHAEGCVVRVCGSVEETMRFVGNPPYPGEFEAQAWTVAHVESDDSKFIGVVEQKGKSEGKEQEKNEQHN